jgi:hypothetical protein
MNRRRTILADKITFEEWRARVMANPDAFLTGKENDEDYFAAMEMVEAFQRYLPHMTEADVVQFFAGVTAPPVRGELEGKIQELLGANAQSDALIRDIIEIRDRSYRERYERGTDDDQAAPVRSKAQ